MSLQLVNSPSVPSETGQIGTNLPNPLDMTQPAPAPAARRTIVAKPKRPYAPRAKSLFRVGTKITEESAAYIKKAREEGKTIEVIAEHLGINYATICSHMKRRRIQEEAMRKMQARQARQAEQAQAMMKGINGVNTVNSG